MGKMSRKGMYTSCLNYGQNYERGHDKGTEQMDSQQTVDLQNM